MKVKEFIQNEWDVDVYNDVDSDWGICACCPITLTEEGRKRFAAALECEIEMFLDDTATVLIDSDNPGWIHRWKNVRQFFESAAGYCTEKEYDQWFTES